MTGLPDGLYKVEISGFGHTSFGVVVLSGSRLLGGDSSHYFSGVLAEEEGGVRVQIAASPHSQQARPAFGPLSSAHLVLAGLIEPGGGRLLLSGLVEEIRGVAVKVCLTPLAVGADEKHAQWPALVEKPA